MLGFLNHGTKLEANARNSVPNHSAEEKTTRNSVPRNKNISRHMEFCSEPFRGRDNNSNSVPKHVSDENMPSILLSGAGFLAYLFFYAISFHSELRKRFYSVEFVWNEIPLPILFAVHATKKNIRQI
jgi:hypothetical protein